ncbi:PREDICTED: uncharacterized protein LOC109473631 [Branchiostoma belcheri]|uniref:Uncharacterized protein LOC109473631 n=1 Tax=Branchiostoma belcheri TaxID=7741 RepID=A0A6P4Z5D3_BRABE|nr:PREDICTED: uncharacterized protein LOC109473631 [Branchiostoma belcheri]
MGCGSSSNQPLATEPRPVPNGEPVLLNVHHRGAGDGASEVPSVPAIVEPVVTVTSPSPQLPSRCRLTVLHFNDVYNIEERPNTEPVGGAARFASAMGKYWDKNPLVFFSGDCLNPSMMSSITKGKQMVPVLNSLKVKAAVYGNHDFDFGVDELEDVTMETKFPWLMSNVIDTLTDKPLADGLEKTVIVWGTKKIGLIGLVEEEWLVTLATVDKDDLKYLDYVEEGRRLAKELKEEGADLVIALTHMRWPNDVRLAEEVEEVDLILGGHDHDYDVRKVNGKYIVKSGTEFRQFTKVEIDFIGPKFEISTMQVDVTSAYREDGEMKKIVEEFTGLMSDKTATTLGRMESELDGRFATVRTQESALGNFLTDVMVAATQADLAILNSGTMRSDSVHGAGDFTIKDLLTILPLIDPLVVLEATGTQIMQALENGVSQYPKTEGRFPQVSGIVFGFDPEGPAGSRVDPNSVKIDGEYLVPDKVYKVCTKAYIARGKDGYDVFKDCKPLTDPDEGPILSTVIQNHFTAVDIVKGLKPCRSGHHQSLINVASVAK